MNSNFTSCESRQNLLLDLSLAVLCDKVTTTARKGSDLIKPTKIDHKKLELDELLVFESRLLGYFWRKTANFGRTDLSSFTATLVGRVPFELRFETTLDLATAIVQLRVGSWKQLIASAFQSVFMRINSVVLPSFAAELRNYLQPESSFSEMPGYCRELATDLLSESGFEFSDVWNLVERPSLSNLIKWIRYAVRWNSPQSLTRTSIDFGL